MPDVWTTLTELDNVMQQRLANMLETRGVDPNQQAMRRAFLGDISFPADAHVLEDGLHVGPEAERDRRIAFDLEVDALTGVEGYSRVEVQAEFSERAPCSRLFPVGALEASRVVACDGALDHASLRRPRGAVPIQKDVVLERFAENRPSVLLPTVVDPSAACSLSHGKVDAQRIFSIRVGEAPASHLRFISSIRSSGNAPPSRRCPLLQR
jgi:hypothetical protein